MDLDPLRGGRKILLKWPRLTTGKQVRRETGSEQLTQLQCTLNLQQFGLVWVHDPPRKSCISWATEYQYNLHTQNRDLKRQQTRTPTKVATPAFMFKILAFSALSMASSTVRTIALLKTCSQLAK